jgi:hypothetical protein
MISGTTMEEIVSSIEKFAKTHSVPATDTILIVLAEVLAELRSQRPASASPPPPGVELNEYGMPKDG